MGLLSRITVALEGSSLVSVTGADTPNLDLRKRAAAFVRPAGRQAAGPVGRDVCDVYVLNATSRDSSRYDTVEALQAAILEILRSEVDDCYPDQSPVTALDSYSIVEGARQTYSGFMIECVGGP